MSEPKLTEPNQELARQVRLTPHGMAHWADSGPPGTSCGKCMHYGYYYENTKGVRTKKPSNCELYYRRAHRHGEHPLPAATPSCKYYEELAPKE